MEIKHPPEFDEYYDDLQYMITNDTYRVHHKFKDNGEPCSIGKDPCLTFTKYAYGWVYHCFRCGKRGYLDSNRIGPEATLNKLQKQIDASYREITEENPEFTLPFDSIPMTGDGEHYVPWEAKWWLQKYQIKRDDMKKFDIHYSHAYRRVIIPIYEFNIPDDKVIEQKLVGWIGRDPTYGDKNNKEKTKSPKYLTKKKKGVNRLLYLVPETKSDYMIVVEDAISAIKVNKATEHNTIALLTSSMSNDLMQKLRGFRVFIWLDNDMKEKAIGYVTKMNQIGIRTECITSVLDPKSIDLKIIKQKIEGRIVKHDKDA